MRSEDTVVQFQGFHPTDQTRNFFQSVIDELKTESPKGATIRAYFTRRKETLKGMIKVMSGAGPFFVKATGRGSHEVAHKLLEQMRRRLDKWKSKRNGRKRMRSQIPIAEEEF